LKILKKRKELLKKRINEEFSGSRGTYGPDRIIAELQERGERLGRLKWEDLLQEMPRTSSRNRHKIKSLTNSKKAQGGGHSNILREQELPIAA